MDITPVIQADRLQLQSYGAGCFIINGKEYNNSIILSPSVARVWPHNAQFSWDDALAEALIQEAQELGAEVVIVGCGSRIIQLPLALKQRFRDARISIDVMDTGAACRTYNVLLSEERKVMAALVLV